ncbi:hypothetical protein RI129_004228 [Pyrocoelia pectoralis]|uniref:DUF1279 domain-containing protein n=1 Tax=Pyrocoelia pectoralis TaxID=417401 RepID=A0AAN7VKN4_9COLE
MATLCLRRLNVNHFININTCDILWPATQLIYNRSVPRYYNNFPRQFSSKTDTKGSPEKQGLFQKFKAMYRDYWYVLVPVHLVTSAAWFGGFYYMAKSGVDIVGILESWNVSEKITNKLKDSHMGYLAVSYALYKLSTPLRYTVTIGGTTLSIGYLQKWGYIKPVPSADWIKERYKEQKENIIESFKEKKEDFYESVKDRKVELQIKKDSLKTQKDKVVKDLEGSLEKIKKPRNSTECRTQHK